MSLENNYINIKKPQSLVAILDNAYKYNVFIPNNIKDRLIEQCIDVFQNNY